MTSYLATVAFDTDVVDKAGNPKVNKQIFLVESESVVEADTRIVKYLHDSTMNYEIISIVKSKIEGIVHPKTTPDVYETE